MKRLVEIFTLMLAATVILSALAGGDVNTSSKDSDAYFRTLDLNRDGRLSKDEFLKIAEKFRDRDKLQARQKLGQTYDKLDPQQRGLSRDQFRQFVETRAKKRQDSDKKSAK